MFGLYLGALLLVCLTPGPNVFLSLSCGLQRGIPAVLQAVAGIALASGVFLALSVLGITSLISSSPSLFAIVRIGGALYLLYLGAGLLWASRTAGPLQGRVAVGGHPLAQGFVTHISNPKAILFWTALLPQFIVPTQPLIAQTLRLGCVGIVIDVCVLSGYGVAAAALRERMLGSGIARGLDLTAGAFFTAIGLWLLAQ
jgi:threonine/homoserine/homoserine lactone efflux protein